MSQLHKHPIDECHPPFERQKTNSIPIWIYLYHSKNLCTSSYVFEEPNQPTKYSNWWTTMWIGIFQKKMLEDFFCPLVDDFERDQLWSTGKEEKPKSYTQRDGGRLETRCAQCMQGHQSINTREPVSFRFAMGPRIVLLTKHIHPIHYHHMASS